MKSIFVFNLLLIWCSISVFSQDDQNAQSSMVYGIKLGVNYSNTEYDKVSHFGFIGGGYLNFELTDILSIQPEILYSMIRSSALNPDVTKSLVILNYIEIPLLLKISLPSFSNINPNIFGGSGLSIFIANEESRMYFGPKAPGSNLLLLFGGGGKINLKAITIGFELRYTIGFSYMVYFGSNSEGWEKSNSALSLISILEF